MTWQGRIVTTPDTLFGKPRIAGTRIGVELLLELFASGWTEAEILDNYPQLKPEDLRALFAREPESCAASETHPSAAST